MLFGWPTEVPGALQIDSVNRPDRYAQYPTLHPTRIYESIWLVTLTGRTSSAHVGRGFGEGWVNVAGFRAGGGCGG